MIKKLIGSLVGIFFVILPLFRFYKVLMYGAFFSKSDSHGLDKLAMIAIVIIPLILFFLVKAIRQSSFLSSAAFWLFPYVNYFNPENIQRSKDAKLVKDHKDILTFKLDGKDDKAQRVLTLTDINRHLICFGGSGSGKTYSFGKPVLSYLLSHRPGILMDPKGDLAEYANGTEHKYPIIYFNPDNAATSRINPLELLNNKTDIIDFSNYFLANIIGIPKDDSAIYFFNSCNSILSAVILFLKKRFPEYCTLPHVIGILLTANAKKISGLLSSDPESARLGNILETASGNEKNISSIMSTFSAFFAKMDSENIFYTLTTDNNIIRNAPNDPANPYVLLLSITSPSRQDIYAPIFSALTGTLLRQMNYPNRLESFFFSDEFSVFKYPKYSLIPETARSNGIASVLLMQDIEQLIRNYGKEEAISIIGNHSNHFIFKTRNAETLTYYESLLGKEEQWRRSYSNAFLKGTTTTDSIVQREVLNKNEISLYDKGQFFGIFNDSNYPITRGFKLNGSHYTQEVHNKPFELNSNRNFSHVYDKVYKEVELILSRKTPDTSAANKPFNI